MPRQIRPLEDRIAQFSRPLDNGCIEWVGTRDQDGYGKMTVAGRILRAHRVAYELFVGPIPEGLTIDHLCRNPSCVNPAHMEPVTKATNSRREIAARPLKTHCKNGHEFTPKNTVTRADGQGRRCMTCQEASRASRNARRAKGHLTAAGGEQA